MKKKKGHEKRLGDFVPGCQVSNRKWFEKIMKKSKLDGRGELVTISSFFFSLVFENEGRKKKRTENKNDHSLSATVVSRCVALCGESGNRILSLNFC